MNSLIVLLRLIHIFAGVFWTGAVLMMVGFLSPTIKESGPEGGRFMQRLVGERRLPMFMSLAALLTTLSGLWLYWLTSGGFHPAWITSGVGLGYTVGGAAGVLAFVVGLVVQEPAARRVAALGQEMQAAGGPPTPAQQSEMGALQKRIGQGGLWTAVMLAIAVLAMSMASYLGG